MSHQHILLRRTVSLLEAILPWAKALTCCPNSYLNLFQTGHEGKEKSRERVRNREKMLKRKRRNRKEGMCETDSFNLRSATILQHML